MDEVLLGLVGVISSRVRNEKKKAMMMEIINKTEEALLLGATDLQYAEVLTSLYCVNNNIF